MSVETTYTPERVRTLSLAPGGRLGALCQVRPTVLLPGGTCCRKDIPFPCTRAGYIMFAHTCEIIHAGTTMDEGASVPTIGPGDVLVV